MQPLSGNQRPDRLTSLMNMSLVLRLPREIHLCRPSSTAPRLPSFLDMLQNPHVLLTFDKVHTIPCACHAKRHLHVKWSEHVVFLNVFNMFASKCASHHNGVHFFDILTSKSGPKVKCFVHFDFEMCFPPQRRALFRHLNFQKWSEHVHVDFEMCFAHLRATTACTFSTSQLPKVVRR